MKIESTPLVDCYKITPSVFEDNRGYFYESFNQRVFEKETGIATTFVQDNQSRSSFGVMRGLHLQLGNATQAKLVRALEGEIIDVAVDLRPDSKSFKQYFSCVLSAENKQQLFVPRGFAHGFAVLSNFAAIHYKADNYYAPHAESGVIYNDSELEIDWKISNDDISTSKKDLELPSLSHFIETYL